MFICGKSFPHAPVLALRDWIYSLYLPGKEPSSDGELHADVVTSI